MNGFALPSASRKKLVFLLIPFLVLAGCEGIAAEKEQAMNLWGSIFQTACGTIGTVKEGIEGAVEAGESIKNSVTEGVNEFNERIEQVQEGIDKIKEGKELIEGGLGKNEEK